MNVPLRALTWAVRFFWIITIAFAITCVYSATFIRLNFGELTTDITEEAFTIIMPIILDNDGYYNIAHFNITTLITDNQNNHISQATTYIPNIPPQNQATVNHNISISLNQIIANEEYLFNDTNFTLHGIVQLKYANLIPFTFSGNNTIPWGAPLYNFTTDIPQYTPYNATHVTATVPISFQNHSPYFNLAGTIRIEIYNDRHELVGEGTTTLDAPPNTQYSGTIETIINTLAMTRSGQIRTYIETPMFNYGPMVMDYG